MEQINLTEIHRTSCLRATKYTFFWSTHGTFSRINHVYQIITWYVLHLHNVICINYVSVKLVGKRSLLQLYSENFKEVREVG